LCADYEINLPGSQGKVSIGSASFAAQVERRALLGSV
jgi:hypothetical protein